ncbi:MAG TPA: HEAT repeat domain-containing protein, partial [Longimicrobiales bacterium]|nr:HEAT repeat domain-containing protein [Longimicrobiales bacterium]
MTSLIRSSLLVLAVATFTGCAGRGAVETVAPAPGPVRLDDSGVRAAAELLRMEDSRVLDTALVARHLLNPVPAIRARAALAAGRILDRTATPLLLRALADADNEVRASAAFILGELADSSAHVTAALGRIALHDNGRAAVEAAGALGRIGTEAARPFIDSLLTTRRPDPLRHEALIVAWRLPRAPSTLQHLAAATRDDDDAESRWRAAYSLARTAGPGAVQHLLPLLDDEDARVRAHAVRGLRAPLADSANLRERALTAALAATTDTDAHVRINAINLLAAYRENARAVPALVARREDADANVAIAAAQALAPSGDASATGALYALTGNTTRPDGVRTAALTSWMRIDAATAAP